MEMKVTTLMSHFWQKTGPLQGHEVILGYLWLFKVFFNYIQIVKKLRKLAILRKHSFIHLKNANTAKSIFWSVTNIIFSFQCLFRLFPGRFQTDAAGPVRRGSADVNFPPGSVDARAAVHPGVHVPGNFLIRVSWICFQGEVNVTYLI